MQKYLVGVGAVAAVFVGGYFAWAALTPKDTLASAFVNTARAGALRVDSSTSIAMGSSISTVVSTSDIDMENERMIASSTIQTSLTIGTKTTSIVLHSDLVRSGSDFYIRLDQSGSAARLPSFSRDWIHIDINASTIPPQYLAVANQARQQTMLGMFTGKSALLEVVSQNAEELDSRPVMHYKLTLTPAYLATVPDATRTALEQYAPKDISVWVDTNTQMVAKISLASPVTISESTFSKIEGPLKIEIPEHSVSLEEYIRTELPEQKQR